MLAAGAAVAPLGEVMTKSPEIYAGPPVVAVKPGGRFLPPAVAARQSISVLAVQKDDAAH